jgi:hypothetical protein
MDGQMTKMGKFIHAIDPVRRVFPLNRNRKWIAYICLVFVLCGLYVWDTKRADAYATSPLPHGTKGGCPVGWIGTVPVKKCRVLVQPGTAFDIQQRLAIYGENANAFTVGLVVGLGCAKIPVVGPALAPFCALAMGVQWTNVKEAYKSAAAQGRCVQLTWIQMIYPASGPIWPVIKVWGQPQRYIDVWNRNLNPPDYIRIWGNPDDCKTRNYPPNMT